MRRRLGVSKNNTKQPALNGPPGLDISGMCDRTDFGIDRTDLMAISDINWGDDGSSWCSCSRVRSRHTAFRDLIAWLRQPTATSENSNANAINRRSACGWPVIKPPTWDFS